MAITRAQLLAGKDFTKEVEIEGLGAVPIRPLTEGEWAKVQSMMISGTIVHAPQGKPVNVDMDMEKVTLAQFEAKAQAVAYGLAYPGEVTTLDEVKAIRPASIVERLAGEILDISGVKLETIGEQINFR